MIGFINTGESYPGTSEGLVASLYFSITSSTDTQFIFIDTTTYGRDNMTVLSRIDTRLEAVRPVMVGINRYINPMLHVSTTGNDETGDGNIFNPYATIQKAIDAVIDEDTILVHDGVYIGAGNTNIKFYGKESCAQISKRSWFNRH